MGIGLQRPFAHAPARASVARIHWFNAHNKFDNSTLAVQTGIWTAPVFNCVERSAQLFGYFFFGGFTVSTTAVDGRRCASFTGMNNPVFASRPIFVPLGIDLVELATVQNKSLAPSLAMKQNLVLGFHLYHCQTFSPRRVRLDKGPLH